MSNKTEKKDPKRFIVARCAVRCITAFIAKCCHFNYTKELLKNIIPLLNSPNESIREQCCQSMSQLLGKTPIDNVTVTAIRLICDKIKARNFDVSPQTMKCFLFLPLSHLGKFAYN